MTDKCTTCRGEGVVLGDETLAISIERRLRRLAESGATAEAFLVEVHPRVAAVMLKDDAARVKELEEQTGRLFVIEGVSYLALDEYRIGAEGSRDVIRRASLPVSAGETLEVTVEEQNVYDHRHGVARVDGYPVCVAGAGDSVGRAVKIVVDEANRSCAYARLVGP
jgi:ribonuclease G